MGNNDIIKTSNSCLTLSTQLGFVGQKRRVKIRILELSTVQ